MEQMDKIFPTRSGPGVDDWWQEGCDGVASSTVQQASTGIWAPGGMNKREVSRQPAGLHWRG